MLEEIIKETFNLPYLHGGDESFSFVPHRFPFMEPEDLVWS
jgi:hypothetical protein